MDLALLPLVVIGVCYTKLPHMLLGVPLGSTEGQLHLEREKEVRMAPTVLNYNNWLDMGIKKFSN